MSGGPQEGWDAETLGMLLLAGILVILGLGLWYASHTGLVNTPLIAWARWNAELWRNLPGPGARMARDCRVVLAFIASRAPYRMSWSQVALCLETASAPWRYVGWVLFIPPALLAFRGLGRRTRCRRVYSMREIMEVLSERFPSLTPAVRFNLLARESYGSGPWRVSMSPVEWAHRHNAIYLESHGKKKPIPREWIFLSKPEGSLTFNEHSPILKDPTTRAGVRLDEERVQRLFVRHLGGVFIGFSSLPPYAQGLAAAFAAFGGGGAGRRDGQDMLDAMSRSCRENPATGKIEIEVRGAQELWARYHDAMEESLRKHQSFWRPWMVGGLVFARTRGTLSSSQFLWLRAVDRTLWYALNQSGGRRPWVEAMGVWAHFEAEEEIDQAILEPEMLDAVEWLRDDLIDSGWLEQNTSIPDETWR